MVIHLHPNLLNEQRNFKKLDKIFMMIEDGKHTLFIDYDEENEIAESQWLSSKGEGDRQIIFSLIEKIVTSSAYNMRPSGKSLIEISATDNDSDIIDNLKILEDPLFIFVENATSDGLFLRSLIRCFKKQTKRLRPSLLNGWIEIIQAGGLTQIVPLIKVYKNRKAAPYRLRAFVLMDSNKVNPIDSNADVQTVMNYCNAQGISFHCLYKREIENYLPFQVLRAVFEGHDSYNALMSLSADQLDFYDLDAGFRGKNAVPAGQEALFDGLNDDIFNQLRNGISIPKSDLYKLFDSSEVLAEPLLKRCAHQADPVELKNLLLRIDAEL